MLAVQNISYAERYQPISPVACSFRKLGCHISSNRSAPQVVVVNTGQANKSLDRKLRVRAVWYILLAALEDVETQRKGFCFVVSLKTARISQVCFFGVVAFVTATAAAGALLMLLVCGFVVAVAVIVG